MKISKILIIVLSVSIFSLSAYLLFAGTGAISLPKTGQTTSYRAGDDGEMQKGVNYPDPRFNDNGNGTITDRLTGLMWEKTPSTIKFTWEAAFGRVADINAAFIGGYSDWRLPNILELESLTHSGQTDTSLWLNTQGFNSLPTGEYWSSSSYTPNTASAFYVSLQYGLVTYRVKTYEQYVLGVRGGE